MSLVFTQGDIGRYWRVLGKRMTSPFVSLKARERGRLWWKQKHHLRPLYSIYANNGGGLDLKDKAERRMWLKKKESTEKHTQEKNEEKRK